MASPVLKHGAKLPGRKIRYLFLRTEWPDMGRAVIRTNGQRQRMGNGISKGQRENQAALLRLIWSLGMTLSRASRQGIIRVTQDTQCGCRETGKTRALSRDKGACCAMAALMS